MSFVYDTDVLTQLLKLGLSLEKNGQEQPYESHEERGRKNSLVNRIRGMLDELDKQAAPPPKDPNESAKDASEEVSYEDDPSNPNKTAPQLNSTSLESLGALVAWLVANKMTVGGKRIAYGLNEDPKNQEYVLYKLEPNAGLLERADRATIRQGFFVNKDLLTKFIVSRQAALSKKPNKMEQVQLNDLIADANKLLGANISPTYKEPEVVLPDGTELDRVPKELDPKQWGQTGNVPLFVKDLKSADALNVWIKTNGIGLKDENGKVVGSDDLQNFDLCGIVNILSQRAQAKGRGSQLPAAKAYVSYMAQIATQTKCETAQPGQQPGQGQQGTAAAFQQFAALRPFNSNNLNFREIKKFTSSYAPWSGRSDIKGMAQEVDKSIQSALSLMNVKSEIFMLEQITGTSDLAPFKAMTKSPMPLTDVLFGLVNAAGMMYQDFVNTAKNILPEGESLPLQQQMEAWRANMDDINQLRRDVAEDVRTAGK